MKKKVSIVIPVYNESEVIPILLERLKSVFRKVERYDFEVIFVNDGSKDSTLMMLSAAHVEDSRIKIIDLSRNFGHQQAITAGITHVQHDACIVMDADLQDPPELIEDLILAWEAGNNVVRAVRKSRAETGAKGILIKIFHRFYSSLSDYKEDEDTGIFGLMDRKALSSFKNLPEQNRYLPALRTWIGYKQSDVFYDRDERLAGEAKQSFTRLLKYAFDAVLSFSYKPLRIITMLGIIASSTGCLLVLYFIIKRLVGVETAQIGFTTLISLIVFFGGTQLIAIGVLGEYIARIYDEAKHRPNYLINDLIGFD